MLPLHREVMILHIPSLYNGLPLAEIIVKTLECVTNEWKAHLRGLLGLACAALLKGLCFEHCCVVSLIYFVCREISSVDVGCQTRFEGSSDPSKTVKVDAAEE